MSIGIPVKLLHEAENHVVTVEIKNGELYRGYMTEVSDSMNMRLDDVNVTAKDGKLFTLDQVRHSRRSISGGAKSGSSSFPTCSKTHPCSRGSPPWPRGESQECSPPRATQGKTKRRRSKGKTIKSRYKYNTILPAMFIR
jgi:small nuclear ribonucleoprotein (snRNP)-like protein